MSDAVDSDTLLQDLDEQQRIAAQALLGPVCILAGAGTGKTRTLTHRIAYGVATGVFTPNRVMALTFTTRAASELKTRLHRLGVGQVAARTFHATALAQINYFWPSAVGGETPRILDGKGRILGHAAQLLGLKVDTAALRDIAAEIEWRKVSMLSIEQYALQREAFETLGGLKLAQIVELQSVYEQLKDERKQIDFEDVLLACAGMIENEPAVALHIREQYRFFVVDEYQDISPLQHHLLQLWLGARKDLCVVGDASQTIYSFAGATSEYLTGFAREHQGATVVRLEQNYRSAPAVLRAANALMHDQHHALTLRARDEGEPGVVTGPFEYENDADEAQAVADSISAQIASGTRPEDISVLFRVNAQSAAIERALGEKGVNFSVRGTQQFFERPEVRQAIVALRVAAAAVQTEPAFKTVSDVVRQLGWSLEPPQSRGATRDRWESLNVIVSMIDELPSTISLRDFVAELSGRQSRAEEPARQAVTLSTLHASKGLEWDSVYIVGLGEGVMPMSYALDHEGIAEERRLFYVGITRARHKLRLSWSRLSTAGGRQNARGPSRFLADIVTSSS